MKYHTIVADPPWPMPKTGKTTRGVTMPGMPTLSTEELTVEAAARKMREAMRDNSYKATPLGHEVAKFLRGMRSAARLRSHATSTNRSSTASPYITQT
jgi:hypothetical protein